MFSELSLIKLFNYLFWGHFTTAIISASLVSLALAAFAVNRFDFEKINRFWPLCAVPLSIVLLLLVLLLTQANQAFVELSPAAKFFGFSDVRNGVFESGLTLVNLTLVFSATTLCFFSISLNLMLQFVSKLSDKFSRIYSADLLGTALACGAVFFVTKISPISSIAIATAVLVSFWLLTRRFVKSNSDTDHNFGTALFFVLIGTVVFLSQEFESLILPDETKTITQTHLASPGEKKVAVLWDAAARVDLLNVSSGELNMGWNRFAGSTTLITFNGDAFSRIVDHEPDFPTRAQKEAFYDYDLHPIFISDGDKTDHLVIGIGGGLDIERSILAGAQKITAVDINGSLIDELKNRSKEGSVFKDRKVKMLQSDGRHFLQTSQENFDWIQLTGVDTYSSSLMGGNLSNESYLYTVEALQAIYRRLSDNGVAFIHRWYFSAAPRETLRLFNSALVALHRQGLRDPSAHLAVIDAGMGVVVISKKPFKDPAIVSKKFENGVQRVAENFGRPADTLAPGATYMTEANARLVFYGGHNLPAKSDGFTDGKIFSNFSEGFENHDAFSDLVAQYPFDVSPVFDNKPFFFDYYRWFGDDTTGAIIGRQSVIVSLFITLISFCSLAFMLVRRSSIDIARRKLSRRGASYFAILGASFITVELALISLNTISLNGLPNSTALTLFVVISGLSAGSFFAQTSLAASFLRALSCFLFFSIMSVAAIHLSKDGFLYWSAGSLPFTCLMLTSNFCMGLFMGICMPRGVDVFAANQKSLIADCWLITAMATIFGGALYSLASKAFGIYPAMIVGIAGYCFVYPMLNQYSQAEVSPARML